MAHVEFNETYAAASRASQYSHTHTHTHTCVLQAIIRRDCATSTFVDFDRRNARLPFPFCTLCCSPISRPRSGNSTLRENFYFIIRCHPAGGHEFAKIGFFVRLYRVIMFLAKIKIFFFLFYKCY